MLNQTVRNVMSWVFISDCRDAKIQHTPVDQLSIKKALSRVQTSTDVEHSTVSCSKIPVYTIVVLSLPSTVTFDTAYNEARGSAA